jgi:N-acyl homoserine lactone hydrolase
MIRRLSLLPAGTCLVDASVLTPDRPRGELLPTPIWIYLVEGADARFLIDTGMPETTVGRPDYFAGTEDEGLILPQATAEDMVPAVLRRRGLSLRDVDAVVSTHWHFDHAGGNRLFRGTPILVHPAEVEAARAGSYVPECKDLTLDYHYVGDQEEPVPGLVLLHTPGHTPGHLSLLVRREAAPPVLLTVDAVYTRANWDRDVPGAGRDAEAMRKSMARLREIARETGAHVFFGHDRAQAEEPSWHALIGGG